jgi:small subunit ribosomal protein S13
MDGDTLSNEFRYRLRIVGADVDGTLKTAYALARVKGVGLNLSRAMLRKLEIDPEGRAGFLTETDVEKIETILKEPSKWGITPWLMNRRKDGETGKDQHVVGSELVLRTKMDIEGMKEIKTWRGYRHAYGLKVRGQRTKTTGRAGKALGVKKKDLIQRPGAPASESK